MTYTNKRTKKLSTPVEALLVILATVLVAALFIGSLAYALSGPNFEEECTVEVYYVEPGDTLWVIGNRCVGNHCDVRDWITETTKMNNLGKYIYPGQRLEVYVYPDCDPYYGPQD